MFHLLSTGQHKEVQQQVAHRPDKAQSICNLFFSESTDQYKIVQRDAPGSLWVRPSCAQEQRMCRLFWVWGMDPVLRPIYFVIFLTCVCSLSLWDNHQNQCIAMLVELLIVDTTSLCDDEEHVDQVNILDLGRRMEMEGKVYRQKIEKAWTRKIGL